MPRSAKPTVVLVHGAFADAASYAQVIPRLIARGFDVVAPAVPNRSLVGDAAYVASVIRQTPGPVVLVGHSYGGAVIVPRAPDTDSPSPTADGHAARSFGRAAALVFPARLAMGTVGRLPATDWRATWHSRPWPWNGSPTRRFCSSPTWLLPPRQSRWTNPARSSRRGLPTRRTAGVDTTGPGRIVLRDDLALQGVRHRQHRHGEPHRRTSLGVE
ncbi:alpha/beta fold hydrolase [Streptomyces lancefieldiae]|uniref:Alpha/beta fold hydrolase n=1 Tax=Streptomyces lancefieldiae TaxID=3075520 RepID=A0ABU3B130_9ACTN|nr:alpha/beta fold hydrolase [Streptomyces sp. DSM 40712]MDT0616159.1 alpha/beta fold hydrolase [Streptomyces sp. DSM 40712]